MFVGKHPALLLAIPLLSCALAQDYGEWEHYAQPFDLYNYYYDEFMNEQVPILPFDTNSMDFYAMHDFPPMPIPPHCWGNCAHDPYEATAMILDTLPNIPEESINEIRESNPDLLDYIIRNHPNFLNLVRHMEPDTIRYVCLHVPSFGMRLGRLNADSLQYIRNFYPYIDDCVVLPRKRAPRPLSVKETTLAMTSAATTTTPPPTTKATPVTTVAPTTTGTKLSKLEFIVQLLKGLMN